MTRQDLHTHSVFDDGQDTLEDMVRAAVGAGLDSIGLSGHSPLPYDNGWSMPRSALPAYCGEARRLSEKYFGVVKVYCGIEFDVVSEIPLGSFDYVIGSVHHLPVGDGRVTVDESAGASNSFLQKYFDGDPEAACEMFYAQYDRVAANPLIGIVGHFDLITKFQDAGPVFPEAPGCAVRAMEKLVKAGKIFEINTGAVSRGYRKTPYPSRRLLELLRGMDGRICISSDAHSAANVAYAFGEALSLARSCGFRELWQLAGGGFQPVKI